MIEEKLKELLHNSSQNVSKMIYAKNGEIVDNGKKKLLKADGLLATCIQHEMDHLEGILFIDYLSKLKKSMIIKKLSKLKSNTAIL